MFNKLGAEWNFEWTYELFCAVWPAEEMENVDEHRFKNKNRIEKLHASTGSRVKDRSKRKGRGERNCLPDCDEQHEHRHGSPVKRQR
jgi:hypothetical protein